MRSMVGLTSAAARSHRAIGQRLSIVPVAVSHCVNQYDNFYLLTQDGVLEKECVDARGRYI